jgi:uncharacterized protein involved in exopolysaccharide biosynthesis
MNKGTETDSEAKGNIREINIFAFSRLLLKKRRWLIVLPLTLTLLVTGYLLLQPNLYTSRATILPSGSSGSSVSALKELVGLGGGIDLQDENSSALFPVILSSQRTREAVLDHNYTFVRKNDSLSINLYDYFKIENHDRVLKAISSITDINASKRTGEISLAVTTQYPELSRQILERYLVELEDYVIHKRQSNARASKRYLSDQIEKTGDELAEAEDRLQAYRSVNSDWAITSSPEILRDIGRLEREVEVKANTYHYLQQQFEAAKLTEQKDTPVIRLLDEPSLPTLKSGPKRRRIILLTGAASLFAVAFLIILFDQSRRHFHGTNEQSYVSFRDEFVQTFPRSSHFIQHVSNRFSHRNTVSIED